jgi:hypothetical protein
MDARRAVEYGLVDEVLSTEEELQEKKTEKEDDSAEAES